MEENMPGDKESPEDIRRNLEQADRSTEGWRRAVEGVRALLDRHAWEIYQEHGCPFGNSMKGMDVWFEYEAYATPN